MVNLPPELAVAIFSFGAAMILVCFTGKINMKEVEFGTNNPGARFLLGLIGTLFIIFSIVSFVNIPQSTVPTDDQNEVARTVEDDQNEAVPAIEDDQNETIPAIEDDQNEAVPAIEDDQNEATRTVEKNQNEAIRTMGSVSYSSVKEELASGQLERADTETSRIVKDIVGPNNLSCEDLKVIDNLWQNYSEGKFGLRPQLEVWESADKNINTFRRLVGWQIGSNRVAYEELDFSFNAPKGHLPWLQPVDHEYFLPVKVSSCLQND